MKEKNKIVVFGGSFNPPLNSHFLMAEHVLNEFEDVDKIVFIPVNKKYEKDGLEDNMHRYNMLKAVIDKNENFILSDMDLKDEHSMRTIETLEETQKQFPDKEIWFLIGSDNLKELHTWNRAEELLSNYKIIVMVRADDNIDDIIKHTDLLNSYRDRILQLNEDIKSNYSSTYVRAQIKKGKDVRYLMPDEVYFYIKEYKLYM